MNLNFEVINQKLKRLDENIIINKTHNYVYCNIIFSTSDWTGLDKFIIFKDGWGDVYRVHLGEEDEFNDIKIPNNLMEGTRFSISIYGGDRLTTNELLIMVAPSGYTSKFQVPQYHDEKDIFVEIFEGLESKIDNIVNVDNKLICYSNENIVCEVPLISIDDLADVAYTGDYNDLINIPTEFPPLSHTHESEDIVDFEDNVGVDFRILADLIRRERI